ncbi:MAG: biotin-dependent carboxyltransferase [Phycisphaeraceae bacterium]|nr:biotin-dependent carboxyltransferase [Phycisphaeraceae bacterium]
MNAILRVLEPGMLTTVQDLGRPGFSALGVAIGGAADTLSLRIGNRLVGNPDDAAGLEFTLTGGFFEFEQGAVIAVTGGVAEVSGSKCGMIPMWRMANLSAGEQLRIGPVRRGCRVYLTVREGIQVNKILGSRSTHLSARFGGHEGRALKAGDVLRVGVSRSPEQTRGEVSYGPEFLRRRTIRAIETPDSGMFRPEAAQGIWASGYRVSNQSDRAGIRLEGEANSSLCGGRMTSEGMTHGVIEVPENGQPIVLGVDHPTTGGYPVIACVATVDLPILGQLRPRDEVRFERVTVQRAREMLAENEAALEKELPPQ